MLKIVIIRIIVNSLILLYGSLTVHQMIANLMLSPKIVSDCPGKQFLGRVEETMTLLIRGRGYGVNVGAYLQIMLGTIFF